MLTTTLITLITILERLLASGTITAALASLYKKGGLLSKILQIKGKKFAAYSVGDYPNWDNIPNYE